MKNKNSYISGSVSYWGSLQGNRFYRVQNVLIVYNTQILFRAERKEEIVGLQSLAVIYYELQKE